MGELLAAPAELARDRTVKVVILAGAGPAFCAGHDLKELRAIRAAQFYEGVFRAAAR